jgi:prepilin-type N-terminal cleavage/methylation domain-containing protein
MHARKNRSAFTLVEVLIVVVIMAILAATIIPQFTDSTKEAKASTSRFNLHTLRSQIELYKAHHNGAVPDPLTDLTIATDADGNTPGEFGPYVREIPVNPFSNTNTVTATTATQASPPAAATGGGWLYNATTGDIFIDDAAHLND